MREFEWGCVMLRNGRFAAFGMYAVGRAVMVADGGNGVGALLVGLRLLRRGGAMEWRLVVRRSTMSSS